jgi:hypothetical protein
MNFDFAGTVKFVGVIDDNAIAPNLYVGVKLDDNGMIFLILARSDLNEIYIELTIIIYCGDFVACYELQK